MAFAPAPSQRAPNCTSIEWDWPLRLRVESAGTRAGLVLAAAARVADPSAVVVMNIGSEDWEKEEGHVIGGHHGKITQSLCSQTQRRGPAVWWWSGREQGEHFWLLLQLNFQSEILSDIKRIDATHDAPLQGHLEATNQ
jgi:hypothetical protein